jgi:hypothetical protein
VLTAHFRGAASFGGKNEQESIIGGMKHTDPNFWRYALAMVLLCCGGLMIGDGVVRWAVDQSNSSIPAGCITIILGIIVMLGGKAKSRADETEPEKSEGGERQ